MKKLFNTQDLLQSMEGAYSYIKKHKRYHGFQYGKNDCFCLFREYNHRLFGDELVSWLNTNYHDKPGFLRRLLGAGLRNMEDLFQFIPQYQPVKTPEVGDVAVMTDSEGDPTVALFQGGFWYNSSPDSRYDNLPRRLVESRIIILGRPMKGTSDERT